MNGASFELRILGPTELSGPDGHAADAVVRQPKRLALLTYLALTTAIGFRRRDGIIALFWPELDQAQARSCLRKALYAISEALSAEVFITRGEEEVRLDSSLFWCDAVAVHQHARDHRWGEALALYRGDLLEGLYPEGVAQGFHEWLEQERRVLRDLATTAAWECSGLAEARGDPKAAVALARRAYELTADDEIGIRRLMALLDRYGDRAGALHVYAEWQARLLSEYGVEPAPETRKLARLVGAARKGDSHDTPARVAAFPATVTGSSIGDRPEVDAGAWPRLRAGVRKPLIGAGLFVVVAAGAVASAVARNGGGTRVPAPATVAVLRLHEIGVVGSRGDAERLTEELTTVLATLREVTVRAGTAVEESGDVDRIGRRLGVAYVVDGGVQRGPSQVRVTLRLVRTSDGVTVWAGAYDADPSDPMTTSREVAAAAGGEIAMRLRESRRTGMP